MNLRQFRAMHGGLENLTDREIVEFVAQSQGITPDNTPDYDQIIENSLGYDRSLGEVATDSLTQLGQGVVRIGSNLASGFGAWDNSVRRGLDSTADWIGQRFSSEGIKNQRAGTQVYSDIRDRQAKALGLQGPERLAWDAQTQLENYYNAPGTIGEDFFVNAPQLAVGGLAGRGGFLVARGLGLGQVGARAAGVASGSGTAGFMQGSDIGAQTYDEALQAIMARNDAQISNDGVGLSAPIVVTPEGSYIDTSGQHQRQPTEAEKAEAAEIANTAALKSGAFTAATSLLPGSLERSLVPGLGRSSTRMGSVARVGGVEFATNVADEGYGQLATGQGVAQVDPTRDPWQGVGEAGIQGGAAGGPSGFVAGAVAPLTPRQLPRTETGEVDLAGTEQPAALAPEAAPAQPAAPVNYDAPTWVRRGLDPLNERSSPWSPLTPPQTPRLTYEGPTAYVDPTGAVQIGQMPTEQEVAQRIYAPRPADQGPPDDPGGGGGTPLALPYNPTTFVDPTGTAQVGTMPTEQEVAQRRYESQAAAQTREVADNIVDIRRAVREASQALKPGYLKKDGELTKTAEAIMAPFLNAQDPVQALRDAHQNGSHPRDELLDAIHERLTGQTIFKWREGGQPTAPADANSAGFVPEPIEQVQAQLNAARQGRKGVVVLGTEQANQLDLSGLAQTTATDPNTGEQAVVVSRNRAAVQRAAARAQEVGLRQALGEAQNVVDPTLTSQAAPPDEGVVAVQQVDNETGQVLADELVTPENVDNVQPIPDTTRRVVPADQPVQDRRAAAAGAVNAVNSEPTTKKPKAPKKPRYGKKTVPELIDIAENTKEQVELDAAELELYKRWLKNADEAAENYFTQDIKPKPGQHPASAFGDSARAKELQAMLEAEQAEKLARKFNSVKARPANEVTTKPLTVQQVQTFLDSIKRTTPAARDIQVMQSPADAGLEFDDGLSVAGVTFPDGRIVLFADGLTSRQDVMETVFHELFHKGVTRTPNYEQAMRDIAASDPWIRAQANQWKLTPDGRRQREGRSDEQYDALAVDEALARVSERLAGGENIGSRRTAVRGLVKWLAAKADAWGMRDLARWLRRQTYTDAERFVLDTLDQAAAPGPAAPTPTDTAPVRARAVDTPADSAPAETAQERIALSERLVFTRPFARAAKRGATYITSRLTGRDIDQSVLSLASPTMIQEQLGHKLPAFKQWFDTVIERGAHARKLSNRASVVAEKWQKLSRADGQALGQIMLEASSLGLELDNSSADYLKTLDADERAAHARLVQQLKSLPENAQTIRKEVLDVLRQQWQDMRDGLIYLAEHTIHDPAARAERVKQIKEGFGRTPGDYFPLSRFGDTIVIARGAAKDGRDVITFHESTLDAEREQARWRREGVKADITKKTDTDFGEKVSTNFMNQIHQVIDQVDADPSTLELLHDAIQQMYLKSMPEFSGAKLMIRRENIEGYSKDASRGFADAVMRGSKYAARLRYGPQLHAALEAARVQSRSSDQRTAALVIGKAEGKDPVVQIVATGTDRLAAVQKLQDAGYEVEWSNTTPQTARETLKAKTPHLSDGQVDSLVREVERTIGQTEQGGEDLRVARELYNYILRRTADDKNTADGVVANIVRRGGQFGFFWFLGLTPTYWFMNSLQNHLVMLPHLGGRYGVNKSQAEMHKAMLWFLKIRMGKLLRDRKEPFSIAWLRKNASEGVSEQEFRFLERLEDRGRLDITRTRDLSQIAEDSTGKLNKWLSFAAAGAHHTEVFNRVVAALTAYRLARKHGASHEQAMETAENDVVLTHIDYSQDNTANFMKGPYAGRIFMFQKYRQGMLYWWIRQFKDALKGAQPEDRKAARKAMGLMAASHLLAAGVRGMPFAGAFYLVADLIAGALGDDDEPFDLQLEMEEGLEELLGPGTGRFFARGVFDAMGLDLSHRIGQHDLVPFTDWSSAKYERDGDDKVRAYLFDMLGPLGSVALNWGNGVEAMGRGDWLAAGSYMSPKFASDIFKAIDLHEHGLRDKRGRIIAQRELFDGFDIAIQAAGTRPTTTADIRRERGKVRDIERHYQERGSALTRYFVTAFNLGDQDGVQDAVEAVTAYNTRVARKFPQYVITGRRLESAVRAEAQRQMINALTEGTADTRRQLLLHLQMSQMVPRAAGGYDPTELPSVGILD